MTSGRERREDRDFCPIDIRRDEVGRVFLNAFFENQAMSVCASGV